MDNLLEGAHANFPGVKFKGPWVNIWGQPQIGPGTEIGAFVEIVDDVIIGTNCKIGAYSFLCPGVRIGENVFIGPRVTFLNDRYPPSPAYRWQHIHVGNRAVIGAGAILLSGVTIGESATIGAGAVVVGDVVKGRWWIGNPAKPAGETVLCL